jgi:hypothetical protein
MQSIASHNCYSDFWAHQLLICACRGRHFLALAFLAASAAALAAAASAARFASSSACSGHQQQRKVSQCTDRSTCVLQYVSTTKECHGLQQPSAQHYCLPPKAVGTASSIWRLSTLQASPCGMHYQHNCIRLPSAP